MDVGVSPRVGASLVTRGRPEELAAALDRLASQTVQVARLVVVNVEADAVSRAIVSTWQDEHPSIQVDYLAVAENIGPSGAVARATPAVLSDASIELVLLLEDDDPLPATDSLAKLVAHLERAPSDTPRVGGVGFHGARFDQRRGRLHRPALGDAGWADVDYLAGGHCPLIRRAVFDDVGTYDPRLFFGFEELEFGVRARDAGWRLQIIGGAHLDPGGGAVGWGLPAWSWRRYYSLRNLIVILLRRGAIWPAVRVTAVRGIARPLVHLPVHPLRALRHLRSNARAIVDAWRGNLGRTVEPPSPVAERPS